MLSGTFGGMMGIMVKCKRISRILLVIYLMAELLRITSLLMGSAIFKISTNNIGAGSASPIPQTYYFLGETFRPMMSVISIVCGLSLAILGLYAFCCKNTNLDILKKMLIINCFVIILTLYLLYIAANVFGITPAIYNYCTYNLSSIFVILLLCGFSLIIQRRNQKKDD